MKSTAFLAHPVILLTLCAALLRIPGLPFAYSGDDLTYISLFSSGNLEAVWTNLSRDTAGVLYPLLLFSWRSLGDAEWVVRSLSVVLGTLSVPLLFRVALDMSGGNYRVAVFSTLLLAVSPLHIEWCHQIKPYGLWILLSLAATVAACAWARSARRSWLALWIGAATASWYSHQFAPVFLVVPGASALLVGRQRRREWLIAQGVVLLLVLPQLMRAVLAARGLDASNFAGPNRFSPMLALPEMFLTLFLGYSAIQLDSLSVLDRIYSWRTFLGNAPVLLSLLLSCVATIPVLLLSRDKYRFRWLPYVCIPVAAVYVASFAKPALFSTKYAAPALPFLLIGASIAYVLAHRSRPERATAFACLVLVLFAYSDFNYYFRNHQLGRRTDWRGAMRDIESHEHAGDVIATYARESTSANAAAYVRYYYKGELAVEGLVGSEGCSGRGGTNPREAEHNLAALAVSQRSVWLIAEATERSRCDPARTAEAFARDSGRTVIEHRFSPALNIMEIRQP